MSDYIEREDAINTIRNTYTGMTADTLELRFDEIPSADVVPVRHGRWEPGEENSWWCSECDMGWDLEVETPKENNYNYCPNCGARMDGDKE